MHATSHYLLQKADVIMLKIDMLPQNFSKISAYYAPIMMPVKYFEILVNSSSA